MEITKIDEFDVVIYHGPCLDGFGAAFSAWLYLSERYPGKEVRYIKSNPYKEPPQDLEGKCVLITDTCFAKPALLDMLKVVKHLTIIDHHKTSEKELVDIQSGGNFTKIFDMDHSAARLTWNFFHPSETVPLLIQYIEDGDLWKKQMPNAEWFSSWFGTVPQEFEEYTKYLDNELLVEKINQCGPAFDELNKFYVKQELKSSAVKFQTIGGKHYFVAYSNSSIQKSQVVNQLLTKYNLADFSAVYTLDNWEDKTMFSLRSLAERVDVSVVAKELGGGGHRNASGCSVNLTTNILPGIVHDCNGLYETLKNITQGTVGDMKCVYMHANKCRRKLGEYLLSIKYGTIQQASNILSVVSSDKDVIETKFSIALVWNYNPIKDTTIFVVKFDKSVKEEDVKEIKKMWCLDLYNKVILRGLHKTLDKVDVKSNLFKSVEEDEDD